jgi:acetate kinase
MSASIRSRSVSSQAVADDRVLVVNAGSTSLKLSVVASDDSIEAIESIAAAPDDVLGVAHRVVHGGVRFREPVIIDDAVEDELRALAELAPLHNRRAIAAIDEARHALSTMRHVAVFDTAFHATIPDEASTFAVPRRWREEWGIRRFGFHGLSVQWAAQKVPVERLVVCHLGGGCSVTAVHEGRSVDTTMGYSPLDGVPMATRSGSIDPEIPLHLLRAGLLQLDELEHALENDSGLRGLSDRSARYEELQAAGDAASLLALAVFAHRVAGAVAAMTASLGGLDALVFTAGIGENSAQARADISGRLRFLGVELDAVRNEGASPDAEIARAGSPVRVVVLRAREDVVAARAARALLL